MSNTFAKPRRWSSLSKRERAGVRGNSASKYHGASDSPTNSAFTLIELLVVITIFAILFALIGGALHRGKFAAQRVACLSNLRQWGCVAHIFAQENDDELPREAAVDGINTWEMTASPTNQDVWYNALAQTIRTTTMAQYAQTPSSQQDFYTARTIFHCPRARFSAVSATYPNFSLAINSKLMRDFENIPGPGSSTGGGMHRLSEIKAPDRTVLFLDNGVPGEERLCPYQPPYTGEPKASASQFPGRHNRGGNILFADSHAATMKGTEVVEMNPTSVFRGRAIYPSRDVVWRHDPALVP